MEHSKKIFGGGRFRGRLFENNNNSPERAIFHLDEPRARRPIRWIHNYLLDYYPNIHQGRWIQINEHQYVQLYHRISEEHHLQEAFLSKPRLGNTLFEQGINLFRNAADIRLIKQYFDDFGRLSAQNHVYDETPNNTFIGLLGDSLVVDKLFRSEVVLEGSTITLVTLAVISE